MKSLIRHWNIVMLPCNFNTNNVKALIRRGITFTHLDLLKAAKSDLTLAQKLEPKNESVDEAFVGLYKALAKHPNEPTKPLTIAEKFNTALPKSQIKCRCLGDIPRLAWTDPVAISRLKAELPVIFTDLNLAEPAVKRWNLDYLNEHLIGNKDEWTVFISREPKFTYYEDDKNVGGYQFIPPTIKESCTMKEILYQIQRQRSS